MTSSEKILAKTLVASGLDSSEWNTIQAGLRDRAFFSAQVESARFLYAARQRVAEIAAGGKSASETRHELRQVLAAEDYMPEPDDIGGIKDLTSRSRLNLIINTNVRQARGYVQYLEANTPGALRAFPARELIRTRISKVPRDWSKRWTDAGGEIYGGRMIALKTSDIWEDISYFGEPYPPFDFNSGMGVIDVSRRDCLDLGVISADDPPQEPAPLPGFNDNLEAEVPFPGKGPEWDRMKGAFGDQIKYEKQANGRGLVKWQGEIIREMLADTNQTQSTRLGVLTKTALSKGSGFIPEKNRSLGLTVTGSKIRHVWKRHGLGGEDTRGHPLRISDLDLIPLVWRCPDRVSVETNPADPDNPGIYFDMDMFYGPPMRLVMTSWERGNQFETFYPYLPQPKK